MMKPIIKPINLFLLSVMIVTMVMTGMMKGSIENVKVIKSTSSATEIKGSVQEYIKEKGSVSVKEKEAGITVLIEYMPFTRLEIENKEDYLTMSNLFQYNSLLLIENIKKNKNVAEVIFKQTIGENEELLFLSAFTHEQMLKVPLPLLYNKEELETQSLYVFSSNQVISKKVYKYMSSDLPEVYADLTVAPSDEFQAVLNKGILD